MDSKYAGKPSSFCMHELTFKIHFTLSTFTCKWYAYDISPNLIGIMVIYSRISQNKLTNLIKFYKQHELAPRMKRFGGCVLSRRLLTVQDIQRIKQFIANFADVHAMPLPGRIPGFKQSDIQVLPTMETMTSVWWRYKSHRAAGNSTFRKLWRQQTPNIVIGKPITDLCWVCQKNNNAICHSSNLPDCVKSAKLRKQEQHLCIVGTECQAHQDMVICCRATVGMLGVKLGPNPPCSQDLTMHYSFDYAQQYRFGEKHIQLHCDSCSGQNKNKFVLWYLAS
ncbi:uncharacterized protein LOC121895816 isoform X2 [Thunnus maccoyii]|uniref:uncharacterized protein LOC121895816 isoform X2 n=1 Tax=Thunnus maccoyii TaxID=8240 RepID=UPI001C4D15B4|nr:uncharacterized protein LOC121895816 isoform X2 [Thunnus maccoyii]